MHHNGCDVNVMRDQLPVSPEQLRIYDAKKHEELSNDFFAQAYHSLSMRDYLL